jgi:hypothetical protein
MKVFISACAAAILIAVVGLFVLQSAEVPADVAFATSSVRLGS